MGELLKESHLLITKGGPNMILEGSRSGNAIIVTDHIPGQESKNYKYISNNQYGIKCENPSKIFNVINDMINTKKLDLYLKNVVDSKSNDGTKIIAETIKDFLNKNSTD